MGRGHAVRNPDESRPALGRDIELSGEECRPLAILERWHPNGVSSIGTHIGVISQPALSEIICGFCILFA